MAKNPTHKSNPSNLAKPKANIKKTAVPQNTGHKPVPSFGGLSKSTVPETPKIKEPKNESTISSSNKPLGDDKKELMRQIGQIKKENVELKKKLQESEKMNTDLLNEVTESQQNSEHFIKEKNDMEVIYRKAQSELKSITEKNEELMKKYNTLEEDMEILKEESETKDLEKELLQKKFDEFKKMAEEEINNLKKGGESVPVSQPVQEGGLSQPVVQGSASDFLMKDKLKQNDEKINELEDIVNSLSTQLKSTTEQRDYAINYYKEEISKLNTEMDDLKSKVSTIPGKDDLIRQLTEKLKEDESIMETFRNQINALSPANDMYEQIIIEKDELEKQMEDMKAENEKMKEDMANDEEMINDLESALKISEQMMKKSQDEAIQSNNKLEEMKLKIKQYEENEKNLLKKLDEMKKMNKIIKEEAFKSKDSTMNFDDILSKNMTTVNKMQSLKRQQILINLSKIDLERLQYQNNLVKNMIPKSMFEKGHLISFDKFLNVRAMKLKAYELILNELDNEILTEDLGTNTNFNPEERIEKVEGENIKKKILFHKDVLNSLLNYYSNLFNLEAYMTFLTQNNFLKTLETTKFVNIYSNANAGMNILEGLITLIKNDSLSMQFQSEVTRLNAINDILKAEIFILESFKENNLHRYLMECLYFLINASCQFKIDRIDIIIDDLDRTINCEKLRNTADAFFEAEKNFKSYMNKLSKRIFNEFKYAHGNVLFDLSNQHYGKLRDTNVTLPDALSKKVDENFDQKYKGLLQFFNKVTIVINSQLEKTENKDIETAAFEDRRRRLSTTSELMLLNEKAILEKFRGMKANPQKKDGENNEEEEKEELTLPSWYKLSDTLYKELSNVSKMQDELVSTKSQLKEEKLKLAELTSKHEDLKRSKNVNDEKLGELMVKIGKITQLETQNNDFAKKIEKYKMAVDNLQKDKENNSKLLKDYKSKYEKLSLKKDLSDSKKGKQGFGAFASLYAAEGEENSGMVGNFAPLLNTVCLLQRERKYFKSKLMREKVSKLMEDEDSFMNKFIRKDYNIVKKDAGKEKERVLYKNYKETISDFNKGYETIRNKMSLPTVLDISKKDYDYNQYKRKQENDVTELRINYMKNANKILFGMFGDGDNENQYLEIIDNDVSKTIDAYGSNKLLVGKININENTKAQGNDVDRRTLSVPLAVSENGLRLINKTFMH